MLTLLNFGLDALLGEIKPLNVLLFTLANLFGPLWVTPIELLQELFLGLLELCLGSGKVLVDGLHGRVCVVECLVQRLLLRHQLDSVSFDSCQFIFYLSGDETGKIETVSNRLCQRMRVV